MVSHVTTFSENKVKEHMDTIICSFIPTGNPASTHLQRNLQARATKILGWSIKQQYQGCRAFKNQVPN